MGPRPTDQFLSACGALTTILKVLTRQRWKAFPEQGLEEPLHWTDDTKWSWAQGQQPQYFTAAYRQWITAAGQAWCGIDGMPEVDQPRYTGRAAGFVLKPTPVMDSFFNLEDCMSEAPPW